MARTEREFRQLVRQMREAQNRWFRSQRNREGPDREALSEAKSLERAVDKELDEFFSQRTLFDT